MNSGGRQPVDFFITNGFFFSQPQHSVWNHTRYLEIRWAINQP